VIAGTAGSPGVDAMRRAVEAAYVPNRVLVFRADGDADRIGTIAPYTRDQESLDGAATAYVCRNFACERPMTDPGQVSRALAAAGP